MFPFRVIGQVRENAPNAKMRLQTNKNTIFYTLDRLVSNNLVRCLVTKRKNASYNLGSKSKGHA